MSRNKAPLLVSMVVAVTPLVLGGADSAPQPGSRPPAVDVTKRSGLAQSSITISGSVHMRARTPDAAKGDSAGSEVVISCNSDALVSIGDSDRLKTMQVVASKARSNKLQLNLVFTSGTKMTVDLQRGENGLIRAENASLQINCAALQFDFERRSALKQQSANDLKRP